MAEPTGPFALPDEWVHADASPTWSQLGEGRLAFVRWRLDRWPSLERLHRLARAMGTNGDPVRVVGLHPEHPGGAARVRDALLTRGTWAPSGLGADTAPVEAPGEVVLVDEGEVEAIFEPSTAVATIAERLGDAGDAGWRPRGAAPGPWPLAFPGDVAVGGSRLAVADTGHHRVVVDRPGGDILHIVGDGVPADDEGSLSEARFEAPRGVCWRDDELLVADTSNDRILTVRPVEDRVVPVATCREADLPAGMACTSDGGTVVALPGRGCLARLDDGELAPIDEPSAERHPVDVVAVEDGWLTCDPAAGAVERVREDGERDPIHQGDPLVGPTGVQAGEIVTVADPGAGALFRLDPAEGSADDRLASVPSIEAPSSVDREAEQLVVADGGGHHVWRLPPGEGSSERLRLTESPLALAEHIRLDPVEVAPGAELELAIGYLTGEEGTPIEEVQMPEARGPVVDLTIPDTPEQDGGRIRAELTGRVAASGNLRLRWNVTGEGIGHEAAWDLPIVVRPGTEDRLQLALSTSPP
jgi:hypothetical protein